MEESLSNLRVAMVHEWFETYAGSERVVELMLRVLPQADLFALVDFLPKGERGFIGDRRVRTSFIQRLPRARTHFRKYLPLMPLAVEQFDLSGYDLVISSSHAVAKGVLTSADQLHVCVCCSPMRYAWDLYHQYLDGAGLHHGLRAGLARLVLHYLRMWDLRAANGVDEFVAISRFIARRIRKTYRRRSTILYPPVDISAFAPRRQKEDFYLAASRMVPYKKMDMIVAAFSQLPQRRLVVIGDGEALPRVRGLAGANVKIMGYQPHEVLVDHMQRAKAFVFAATEDFGIMPLEAQACGTPVVAFGEGGCTETVIDGKTGVLFGRQTPESLIQAVGRFESLAGQFDADACRQNAERFGNERFCREFAAIVQDKWRRFLRRRQV